MRRFVGSSMKVVFLSVLMLCACSGAFAVSTITTRPDDPKAIAKALEDGKPVETVMGPVRFDNKGDVLDPTYDINQWSAGKYAPIAK